MSILRVEGRRGPLRGDCRVPGDKSISHRALMFGALARGETRVRGFLPGNDCHATLGVIRGLGTHVERLAEDHLVVHGRGLDGLQAPTGPLDCVNSGTTIRLMSGLLAGRPFSSRLSAHEQLSRRPMGRVIEPLRLMGAQLHGANGDKNPPLDVVGRPLKGIRYRTPVASAQVKSCLILAGLQASGETVIEEPGPTRDHSERMLRAMGAPIEVDGRTVRVRALTAPLSPLSLEVPGDPSSAAFLLVAATLVPGSELTLRRVGWNPTRTGLAEALVRMGAAIEVRPRGEDAGEPLADVTIRHAPLRALTLGGEVMVTLIDEVPILALAATQAEGETVLTGAQELRVKETDRLATTAASLRLLGANIEELPDGLRIKGPTPLRGCATPSHGDHRLVMMLTIAGLIAEGTTEVDEAEVAADSFPGFAEVIRSVGGAVQSID